MERNDPRARTDAYGSRINRSHSNMLANAVPWASIMVASILPVFPIATALPVVPPLGLLMLLGWRLVRPGLLPVWAGLPLGLIDDLFSGQPFGFAMFVWSPLSRSSAVKGAPAAAVAGVRISVPPPSARPK